MGAGTGCRCGAGLGQGFANSQQQQTHTEDKSATKNNREDVNINKKTAKSGFQKVKRQEKRGITITRNC